VTLTPRQKLIVDEARQVAEKISTAGGELEAVTAEESETLLDAMSILSEHKDEDPMDQLFGIMDRHNM